MSAGSRTSRRRRVIGMTVCLLISSAIQLATAPVSSAQPRPDQSLPDHAGSKQASPDRTWNAGSTALRAAARPNAARAVPAHPDVTGDGLADLVLQTSGNDAGALRIYDDTGSPAGNPWSGDYLTTSATWSFADAVLLADVTGDGLADVIARDPAADDGTLWIYPHGAATDPDPWTTRFAAGTGWNLAGTPLVGDVTGDGHADLVARDPAVANGTLWVYPGNGSTTANPWTAAPIWSGTGWNTVDTILLADATGDGRPDIIARTPGGTVNVYPHNGSTSSNFWTSIVLGGTGWSTSDRLSAADVTGDGRPDLVALDDAGDVWVHPFLSTTAGRMWSPTTRRAAGSGFGFASQILPVDVDGNAIPELTALVAPGAQLAVLANNGSPTGNPWPDPTGEGSEWGFAARVMLGDVNGDRLEDLLVLDRARANGTLWIYLNHGSTTGQRWTTRYYAGDGWNIFSLLLIGDVTGDGLADVVGRDDTGDLYAYPGNGSATAFPWQPRSWVGSNWQSARALALGDLDRDGIADLVDLEQDGSLWIFPTGTGDPVQVTGSWNTVSAIAVGDVGGTGLLDLAVLDDTGAAWIHPNTGAATGNPWAGARRPAGSDLGPVVSFVL